MRIAFATSANLSRGREDDAAAATLLEADWVVWNDPSVVWEDYDRVVIRSVWDYTFHLSAFLAWCSRVGPERLRNRPAMVAANADKRYLQDLASAGIPTVPTRFVAPGEPLPTLQGEVVVKPNVSAGGRDTGRFPPAEHAAARELITAIGSSGRTALIQPYLPGVDRAGETAIVFLGGEVSHVLHKNPVLRGPGIAPLAHGPAAPAAVMLEPDLVGPGEATPAELSLADHIHAQITDRHGVPLYGRVDLVPGPGDAPVLMELELIEPCLYLGLAPGATERLAAAVTAGS